MADIEKYFGCDCYCLDHISHMFYCVHEEDDENVIYFAVKTRHLMNRICPPIFIKPNDFIYYWSDYFRYHILRRIPIAIKHILNPRYVRRWGITDCFDFKNDDLNSIKEFFYNMTKEETLENHQTVVYLNNEKWQLRFIIDRPGKCLPYQLGWDLQFIPRNLFGRISYALKYIFGKQYDEQDFEIDEKTTKKLIGMIAATMRANNEK